MVKFVAFLGALLVCEACVVTSAPVYTRNGQEYGVTQGAFRGRYYNYYERGLSYAAGGYCEEAVADFDRAIELRPDDQRRARRHGMRFMDYFPNRERGVCLLQLGKPSEAAEALARSLAAVESERAQEYLSRAQNRAVASL